MADPLQTYRDKRDFSQTKEPRGLVASRKEGGGKFVIHKHAATRLHYDLRLEHDGVLWSWAVTRGPSLDPSEKRLAVHVEDHPYDYGSFEGSIPKGNYGAGEVIVWDEGTWTPEGDPDKGMKKGHISFELDGHKLHGGWHLVRLKPRKGEKRDNWLLIKAEDSAARPDGDILEDEPDSVVSGLSIKDIAEGKVPKRANTKSRPAAEMPDFVPPCLATLKTSAPEGKDWLHEVKFDGYRMQAHIENGKVKLLTRTGLDWTEKFGSALEKALAALDCENAILDGEVVALDESGGTSFANLQQALSTGDTEALSYYLFDAMWLNGEDLRKEPLIERKAKLKELLGPDEADTPLRYSDHFVQPGSIMLKHACRLGLEGVVSKQADAPYIGGRAAVWIKSKCTQRQEFIIVGYLASEKTGRGLRSLLVGYNEKGKLKYAGRVGTGFTVKSGDELLGRLKPLISDKPGFAGEGSRQRGAIWVKPELVAEIEFRAWTQDGILRHASYQGLRDDKPAAEVVEEKPVGDAPKQRSAKVKTSVKLSSPDKVLWPDEGVTKQDLLEYYSVVWPRMERFVVERPLSLVRAPDGIDKQRFFQKHASKGMDSAIGVVKDAKDGEELLFIRDFDGLAALVQLGVVEVHIWGSTIAEIEKPDQIIFDLDPDEGLSMDDVLAATLDVRARLDELGLPNFVKPSGGKGYHVLVPLKPSAKWDAVKEFAHTFAKAMEQSAPEKYTATLSKAARKGRIFIDYLRNGRGSTTVAPYSSRAKKGATASLPVPWSDVENGLPPNAFSMTDMAEIEKRMKAADPWKGFFEAGKKLPG
ncbi:MULTISPECIES: DNA ligase D [Mesorhizobium]|uniref:DNA ligase (ATP) n=1 Tax=Mesorhizobium denitrificans TaxID=2294114 RepID=A0A371XJD7_9HYPH|nr:MULTISPECIES: DNA ligase D [Mesorhizobium]RFC69321.1 DNA ligase D [Mesorhizobium denitrificans]